MGGAGRGGGGGGIHRITIETWKPTSAHGNFGKRVYSQIRQLFMGGNPVLRDDSLVYNNDQRYKLHTMSSGHVTVNLSVMMRNARSVGLSTSVVV
jgi:B9 domain-containing protein 2